MVYFTRYTLTRILKMKKLKKINVFKKFFIFNKSNTILKSFIGTQFNVYKGNMYRKLIITKYLVGFKFGEFTHTTKPFTYPVKKKKNKLRR